MLVLNYLVFSLLSCGGSISSEASTMYLNPRDEAGSVISCSRGRPSNSGGPRHFQLFPKSVTTASLSESSQNDWFAMAQWWSIFHRGDGRKDLYGLMAFLL